MDAAALPGYIVKIPAADLSDPHALADTLRKASVTVIETKTAEALLPALPILKQELPGLTAGLSGDASPEMLEALYTAGLAYHCPAFALPYKTGTGNAVPAADNVETAKAAVRAGVPVIRMRVSSVEKGLSAAEAILEISSQARVLLEGPFSPEEAGVLIRNAGVYTLCPDDLRAEKTLVSRYDKEILGFAFAHLGINNDTEEECDAMSRLFAKLFGFETWDNGNSIYASSFVECMKFNQVGSKGHIAVRTNSAERALAWLQSQGFTPIDSTAKYKNRGRLSVVYFKEEIGGFGLHIIQR